MAIPKIYGALLLFCLLAPAFGGSRQRRSNLFTFGWCLARHPLEFATQDGLCAARQLYSTYREMIAANCLNCDKFFHCIGNSRAMSLCGASENARRGAEAMSNCREEGDGGGTDSRDDQEANLFGRNGGLCASKYLDSVRCAYNPGTKICGEGTTTTGSSYYYRNY